ncbi:hypothetical protein [Actinocorallia herbida]|nr:hypothetical protein [Actinocorallia herbida]
MRLDDVEFEALGLAANRQDLSLGAYGAMVCMAHVRGLDSAEQEGLRDLLKGLVAASAQVRRVGVLFNQVVARLNATGEVHESLSAYGAAVTRTLSRVDDAVEHIRIRLS